MCESLHPCLCARALVEDANAEIPLRSLHVIFSISVHISADVSTHSLHPLEDKRTVAHVFRGHIFIELHEPRRRSHEPQNTDSSVNLFFAILSFVLQVLRNIFHVNLPWLRSLADLSAVPVSFTWKSKSLMRRSASPIVQHLL